MLAQQLEILGVFFMQPARAGKAVNNDAVPALGRVFKAIEDLHGRNRVAVRVVGMCLQAKARISEIDRVHLGPDLEPFAVIRLPHIAEQRCHIQQCAALDRTSIDLGDAIAVQPLEPVEQHGRVIMQCVKIRTGHGVAKALVPGLHIGSQPEAACRGCRVIAVRGKPVGFKGDVLIAVGKADHHLAACKFGRADHQIIRDIGDADQPLAVLG